MPHGFNNRLPPGPGFAQSRMHPYPMHHRPFYPRFSLFGFLLLPGLFMFFMSVGSSTSILFPILIGIAFISLLNLLRRPRPTHPNNYRSEGNLPPNYSADSEDHSARNDPPESIYHTDLPRNYPYPQTTHQPLMEPYASPRRSPRSEEEHSSVTSLTHFCPHCGNQLRSEKDPSSDPLEMMFCSYCGQKLV